MRRHAADGRRRLRPKVVTIWDGFRRWFADQDLAFDYVLYSTLRAPGRGPPGRPHRRRPGTRRWPGCGPAAWPGAGARCGAGHARHRPRPHLGRRGPRRLAGRRAVADLRGRTVGDRRRRLAPGHAAAADHLRAPASSRASTSTVRRFDVGVGLHGDHIGGERDAARALVAARSTPPA